ncbi:MAG TPA: winged helix-turn-helix domain-containing protein [Thermoanaerobaculia bacterium]|nr:winged helix-turn-helix domain-containing protein [Thermoanaerobaculia bacterium]
MSIHAHPPVSSRGSSGAGAPPLELRIAGRLVQPQLNRISGPEPELSVQVEPKVMVLVCLAAAPGEVVSREALIDRVWQGAFVSDDVLTRSIGQLRRLFGDDPEQPRVIETIRKRGYRLIAMPQAVEPARAAATAPAPATATAATAQTTATAETTAPTEPTQNNAIEQSAAEPASPRFTALAPPGSAVTRPSSPAGPAPRQELPDRAAAPDRAARRLAGLALGVLVVLALTFGLLKGSGSRAGAGADLEPGRKAGRDGGRTGRDMRLLPIAGVPANAIRPAIAPDGTRVAFSWNGGAGHDLRLYVALLGAGAPIAVTTHGGTAGASDLDPGWSPDGTLIAFSRQARGACELLTVPALGGPERRLGPCGNDDATRISWSPDGRWLATSLRDAAPGAGPARLRLLSPATLESRALTTPPPGIYGDYNPAFSPDGTRLAFVRALANDVEDLYEVDLEGRGEAAAAQTNGGEAAAAQTSGGGEPRRLTFDNSGIAGVDWLRDGRELVFSSDRGGIYSLWRVAAAGGTPRLLAGSGTKIKHPSAARQRDVVVFESWLYDIGLWRLPLGGGAPDGAGPLSPPEATPLAAAAREWSFQPQFSPDGKRIAFGSTRSGTYELWAADANGAGEVQLTAFGGPHLGTPRWSPDGRRLAFTAWPGGRAALYVVDAAGGAAVPLTPAAAGDSTGEIAPSWSRDGKALYFASRRSGSWQVWKLRLATGERDQVTIGGGYSSQESATGRDLFYSRIDRPGIWRLPLAAGGRESLAAPGLAPGNWGSWTVTGDGIYYLSQGDPPAVQLLPFGASRPVSLATLTDLAWPGFTLSPDRRALVYARASRRECDIVRLENP